MIENLKKVLEPHFKLKAYLRFLGKDAHIQVDIGEVKRHFFYNQIYFVARIVNYNGPLELQYKRLLSLEAKKPLYITRVILDEMKVEGYFEREKIVI